MKKSYHVFSPKYSHAQNNNARYKQLHWNAYINLTPLRDSNPRASELEAVAMTIAPRLSTNFFTDQRLHFRGQCFDHNFLRFSPIFGEKIGVFLKKQCYYNFFII
jgi:hypothetical protein